MKTTFIVVIIVVIGVVVASSIFTPEYLASNEFLKNFVNHEVLNILSVIMTVTVASGANIHLAFNRAEEAARQPGLFSGARK